MPELPEVETVRRGLAPVLVGRPLLRVEARRPDLRFPLPEHFAARLKGRAFERLDRRAKYLIGHLEGGDALIMHLGMTGRFTIAAREGAETLGQYVYGQSADRATITSFSIFPTMSPSSTTTRAGSASWS